MMIFNKLLALVIFLIWIVFTFILLISILGILFIFDEDSPWLGMGKKAIDIILG